MYIISEMIVKYMNEWTNNNNNNICTYNLWLCLVSWSKQVNLDWTRKHCWLLVFYKQFSTYTHTHKQPRHISAVHGKMSVSIESLVWNGHMKWFLLKHDTITLCESGWLLFCCFAASRTQYHSRYAVFLMKFVLDVR